MLRRAPLFAGLDERGTNELLGKLTSVRIRRGETLFQEGATGDKVYVVLSGKMKLTKTSADGRENLLAVIGPGEMFGELSLFDPIPRTSAAGAISDSDLAALGHQELRPWITEHPDVAMQLLRALVQRLRRTNEVMADLVFTDVPGRVARQLVDLSRKFGRRSDNGVHVEHELTQEELAQLVGASRETVNKALADFANRGWLRIEPRAVVLLEEDRLARRARA
ncbi:MAG: Crp/Fnr family transcriptional regulator [Streptosporangiales bacterium]